MLDLPPVARRCTVEIFQFNPCLFDDAAETQEVRRTGYDMPLRMSH